MDEQHGPNQKTTKEDQQRSNKKQQWMSDTDPTKNYNVRVAHPL
jgi:hypothetical protein